MTEAFNKLTADKQEQLQEASDKIVEAIQEAYNNSNDPSGIYPDSVFAQKVVDWLIEESLLQIPAELHADEHFMEHRYAGKVSRQIVNCWGQLYFILLLIRNSMNYIYSCLTIKQEINLKS